MSGAALILGGSPSECWLWRGVLSPEGYGRVRRTSYVHRLSYELFVGPIPPGLVVDHLCRTRACWNPLHLEPVSERTNILRGVGRSAFHAAKTHCEHGHPFDAGNTYIRPDTGTRQCRACSSARDKERACGWERQRRAAP